MQKCQRCKRKRDIQLLYRVFSGFKKVWFCVNSKECSKGEDVFKRTPPGWKSNGNNFLDALKQLGGEK